MEVWNVPVFNIDEIPDGNGDVLSKDVEVTFNNTVCLVREFNGRLAEAIGSAALSLKENTVYANLHFLNTEVEDVFEKLTPAIGGKVIRSITDIKTGKRTILELSIDMISLNASENCDQRIKTLGEL